MYNKINFATQEKIYKKFQKIDITNILLAIIYFLVICIILSILNYNYRAQLKHILK